MKEKARNAFRRRFGHEPALVARAPGRVNLLGEHVDYNEGWVLPVAIDRAAYVAASPRTDELATIVAADLDTETTIDTRALEAKADASGRALEPWALYPAGVAAALRDRGLTVSGINALLHSDVPRGAGLSSSAAIEIAFASAWAHLGGWRLPPEEIATACRAAENDYVGVACGIMDQLASACGRQGHALLVDCRTLQRRPIALPADVAIVIADTGVRRELAAGALNDRRDECAEALRRLRAAMPEAYALRDVSAAQLELHSNRLTAKLYRRARHVIDECARVRRGAGLLAVGKIEAFGALVDESHASLRDLYEASCPELDAMAAAARRCDGCIGARLTGAGFGGCLLALVRTDLTPAFARKLGREYQRATGREARIEICHAVDGATVDVMDGGEAKH